MNQAFSKIWIVVILVVFVAGGILAWQYWWLPKEEVKAPEEKVPEKVVKEETANWKTYNGKYFSFKHPYDWTDNTGPALNYPDNLEVIGLRISRNAVFEASCRNYSYEKGVYEKGIYVKLTVAGREAARFELAGSGEPLPSGFSIISVVVKGSEDTSYHIVFNGDRKDITEELISQVLSTFKFLKTEEIEDETANWKTYRNEEYGFEFKYPKDWYHSMNLSLGDPNRVFCSAIFYDGKDCVWREEYWEGPKPVSQIYLFIDDKTKGKGWQWCELGSIIVDGRKSELRECKTANEHYIHVFVEKDFSDPYFYHFAVTGLNKFPEYQEIFNLMLSTFRFLPPQ